MMRRLLITSALLAVLTLGTAVLLLHSSLGLHLLWALRPEGVSAQMISGRLTDFSLIGLRLADGTRIEQLQLRLDPAALLRGELHLTRLRLHSIHLPAAGDSPTRDTPPALPALPLPIRIDRLEVHALRRDGHSLLTTLQARLDLERHRWRLSRLQLRHPPFSLQGELRLTPGPGGTIHGRLQWRWQGEYPLQGEARVSGTPEQLQLHSDLAGSARGRLQARLHTRGGQPRWQLELRAQNALWTPPPTLGETLAIEATLQGEGPRAQGRLRLISPRGRLTTPVELAPPALKLPALRLHSDTPPLDIHGQAYLSLEGGEHRLELRWRDLALPPGNSPEGHLEIQGRPEDYRFHLQARLHHPRVPLGSWTARGRGDRDTLRLEHLEGELLSGRIEAQGQWRLNGERDWQAQAQLQGLAPQALDPRLTGRIQARLQARGRLTPDAPLELHLSALSGHLNDLPLNGEGEAQRAAGHWTQARLTLQLDEARLGLQGRDQTWDLEARIPRLKRLLPGIEGRVELSGRLAPAPQGGATLRWRLQGRELAAAGYHIARLESEGRLTAHGPWQARARIHTLSARRLVARELRLDLQGRSEAHRLLIEADHPQGRLHAALQGAWRAEERRWLGRITQLRLDALERPFRLRSPARLELTPRRLSLQRLCLHARDSGLCLQLDRRPEGLETQVELTHLPLALATPWLPPAVELQGALHGRLQLQLPRTDAARGHWRISGERVALKTAAMERPIPVELSSEGQLQDEALDATARLQIPGWLDLTLQPARLQLPDATLAAARWREGRLRLRVEHLERWRRFLPSDWTLEGRLALEARLHGAVDDPEIELQGNGREARIGHGLTGLTLHGLTLQARGRPHQGLDFHLQGHTDAPFHLRGRLTLLPPWRLQAHLQGQRVESVRRPDLHLFTSPDLYLEAHPSEVKLRGRLIIPQGEVMPEQAAPPTQVVAEPSEDVVIIGDGDQTPPTEPRWAVTSDLELELGERVFFQGYGLSAWVRGRLRLAQSPGGIPLASGEITISQGRYQAYGQDLAIERGTLTYAATPLDNPDIDLLAVRRIDEITVGLRLQGRLRKPRLTLFADPPMNETTILSYLLFGRPPGEAGGPEAELLVRLAGTLGLARGYLLTRLLAQRLGIEETRLEGNRLVLGRRLGERMFINYAIGLGPEPNLWIVRYRLGSNWELKAEAGAGYSADLFFTLDR